MTVTMQEIDQAIRDAGLGWDIFNALVTEGATLDGRCNREHCRSLAAIANEAGLTIDGIIPAIVASVGDPQADPPVEPDRTQLLQHMATGRAFTSALADLGIAWSINGSIFAWRIGSPALRASTEVRPAYLGVKVTTQAYFEQADLAGATIEDMATALAEYVGDPTEDPPVEPDASAFDAIMGA